MDKKEKQLPEFSMEGLMEHVDKAWETQSIDSIINGGAFVTVLYGASATVLTIGGIVAKILDKVDINPATLATFGIIGAVGLISTALLKKLGGRKEIEYKELVAEVKELADGLEKEGLLNFNKMTGAQHERFETQIANADFFEKVKLKKEAKIARRNALRSYNNYELNV